MTKIVILQIIKNSQHRKGKKSIESKRNTYVLQRSMKFTKTVFFVPSRRTCGGLITVLRLSPASSGLFSRRMLNTLPRSCTQYWRKKIITNSARYYKNVIINRKPMKKRDDTSTNSMIHTHPAKHTLSLSDDLIW